MYLFLTLSAAGAFNCCVVCFLIAEGVFLEEDDADEKVRKSRGVGRLSLFFSDQRRSSNVGELPSPRGSPRRDMWNWRESRQDTRGTDDIVEIAVYLTGAVGRMGRWFSCRRMRIPLTQMTNGQVIRNFWQKCKEIINILVCQHFEKYAESQILKLF